MCYNEEIYEAPNVFDPERFLKDEKLDISNDPEDRVFGSGRRYAHTYASNCHCFDHRHTLTRPHCSVDRSCPGKHFALGTLFLNIACILAVFDIAAPVDEKLDGKYHEGFFRCVMDHGSGCSRITFDDGLT